MVDLSGSLTSLSSLLSRRWGEVVSDLSGFPIIRHGSRSGMSIALTLDDGPSELSTPAFLEMARVYNVPLTFFVVGEKAQKNQGLISQIVNERHELGNHSFDHIPLPGLAREEIEYQIRQTDDIVCQLTGIFPQWFRPPWGDFNLKVINTTKRLKHRMVLWNLWHPELSEKISVHDIASSLIEETRAGSIILAHEGIPKTVEALKIVIPALQERGFQFTTIARVRKDGENGTAQR